MNASRDLQKNNGQKHNATYVCTTAFVFECTYMNTDIRKYIHMRIHTYMRICIYIYTVEQAIALSRDQAIERSCERSSDRASDQARDPAIKRAVARSNDRAIGRSNERSGDRLIDRAAEGPSDRATDRSSDRAIGEVVEHLRNINEPFLAN